MSVTIIGITFGEAYAYNTGGSQDTFSPVAESGQNTYIVPGKSRRFGVDYTVMAVYMTIKLISLCYEGSQYQTIKT